MVKQMTKKIFLVLIFSVFLIVPQRVWAADNFSTSYDVTYQVSESGKTQALFKIDLTNKNDQYYASSYKIRTGLDDIEDVNAYDTDGKLQTNINNTNEGKEIEIVFNKKVVGIGNVLSFNLNFETNNIAYKQGSIWEVNIPGISNQNDFSDFNAHVTVPQSFGDPEYIKPEVNLAGLNFTKEQLGKSGISIAFGKEQVYDFALTYHLDNNRISPVKTEIALPPSTNYQDVFIESISPKPSNVVLDEDGNWLAQYSLLPTKKMDIVVRGKAALFLRPKKEILAPEKYKTYLKEEKYWELTDDIKKLANTLKTPAAIYKYVAKTLKYDLSRVSSSKPRLGAKSVLNNPSSAVCLEFTDLFIALARAAGIPAREIDGYAYTQNNKQRPLSLIKDILHAWPEYYDKDLQTWIMVDPTWGNTTKGVDYFNILDFDHLAFVIRGKDSSYPIPAGGYKIASSQDSKDVFVEFAKNFEEKNPTLEVITNIPDATLSFLPIQGEIILKNKSQTVYPQSNLIIESDFLSPALLRINVNQIPPYGYLKIPVSFDKTPFLTNKTALVKITMNQSSFSKAIKISPFIINQRTIVLGGILLASLIAISIFIITRRAGYLPFFRKRQPDPLRWEGQKP